MLSWRLVSPILKARLRAKENVCVLSKAKDYGTYILQREEKSVTVGTKNRVTERHINEMCHAFEGDIYRLEIIKNDERKYTNQEISFSF